MAEEEHDDIQLLDQKLEDRLFKALLTYDKLYKLVKDAIVPEHFSSTVKSRLFQVLMFHWDNFGSVPEEDILLIEAEEMFKSHSVTMIERYLDKLDDIPVPEWEWLIHRIDRWIKAVRLHKAIFVAADRLKADKVEDATNELVTAIRQAGVIRGGTANALDLDEDQILDTVQDDNLFCCKTKIHALDQVIQGLFRKEVTIILAGLNVGKSWGACHLGQAGLLAGKGVLHLTFEMPTQRVLQRYFQMFSGMVKPRNNSETYREVEVWDEAWENKELERVKTLLHIKELSGQIRNIRAFGGVLSVREYPSGSPKPNDIEHEIMLFDTTFDRPPDLVIVDALTDMDVSGSRAQDRRVVFTNHVTEFMRMARTYHFAGVMTHQANREGLTADVVEAHHAGESLAIVQKVDTGLSFNQTRKEHQLGIMRIFVMRARNQQKWKMIEAYQNLFIGQFCQVSRIMSTDEVAKLQQDEDHQQDQSLPDGQDIRKRLQGKRFRRTRGG